MSTPLQHPLRVEPCACGGEIIVVGDDPDDIANAVRLHNRSERHAEWQRLGGLRYDPELQGRR